MPTPNSRIASPSILVLVPPWTPRPAADFQVIEPDREKGDGGFAGGRAARGVAVDRHLLGDFRKRHLVDFDFGPGGEAGEADRVGTGVGVGRFDRRAQGQAGFGAALVHRWPPALRCPGSC